jgi:nitrogen-specific signal transduction histidine kinase
MGENEERELRASQLAFIGKVLATFSHELKNHLAIINESAGLILDLMELEKSPAREHSDQYVKTLRSIHSQIERTLSLIAYFNRFSHRMDNPLSIFNVNDVMEELFTLLHRFTNQKKITIEKTFQKDIPPIYSDPARLHLLVYCLMQEHMGKLGENSTLEFRTSLSDNAVLISIIPKGEETLRGEERSGCSDELIQGILSTLGGSLSRKEGEEMIRLPLGAPSIHKREGS